MLWELNSIVTYRIHPLQSSRVFIIAFSPLLPFQRGRNLPQVPIRSDSPSPSQEESLLFPDQVLSVKDAWNSSVKQFSFFVEILFLCVQFLVHKLLSLRSSDHCPLKFLLSHPLESRNIGMGTTTFDSFHDINLLRVRAFICCT